MREKIAMLLFPTAGRMDHTIPAIRFVKQQSKFAGGKKTDCRVSTIEQYCIDKFANLHPISQEQSRKR